MRKISKEGLELIKQWEGLRLEAYKDVSGILTIGYGHTSAAGQPEVKHNQKITKEEAESILLKDLQQYEEAVDKYVYPHLTDEQFAALVSFCYNVGINAFKNSTLLKKLNKHDYASVPAELARWNKAKKKVSKGLTNRRAAEIGLWAKSSFISSNYHKPDVKCSSAPIQLEAVTPLIAAVSAVLVNYSESAIVAYALSVVMIIAASVALAFTIKRFKDNKL